MDTADFSPACGFTSYHPAFVLDWDGGTEPFLRLFFTPDEDTATTLLVHTPEDEWLCEEGSPWQRHGHGPGPSVCACG